MSKKKTPRPKVQRCVWCGEPAPVEGSHFCAGCAAEYDEKVVSWLQGNAQPLKGELARLFRCAKDCDIDVSALLADEIERRRIEIMTAALAEGGIEYVRGKPIPEPLRRSLRDATARQYLLLTQKGVRGSARQILDGYPDLFDSEEDVRQHAKRVKARDTEPKVEGEEP